MLLQLSAACLLACGGGSWDVKSVLKNASQTNDAALLDKLASAAKVKVAARAPLKPGVSDFTLTAAKEDCHFYSPALPDTAHPSVTAPYSPC